MEQAGWTEVRAFARHLAGGKRATFDEIEAWRRYLVRWLSWTGDRGMSRDYAELIAKKLGTDPERYLSRHYDERLKQKRQIQRLRKKLRELRDDLDDLN